ERTGKAASAEAPVSAPGPDALAGDADGGRFPAGSSSGLRRRDAASTARHAAHRIDPPRARPRRRQARQADAEPARSRAQAPAPARPRPEDRKSTRLNSSHVKISYAVFCLKNKNI